MSHREWAWLGLIVSALVAARAADPDAVGSPEAPFIALVMALTAVAFGGWLVVDRRHHPHHH